MKNVGTHLILTGFLLVNQTRPMIVDGTWVSQEEIRLMAKSVLIASCIKGRCTCPDRLGYCKYLVQHNTYLERRISGRQQSPKLLHAHKLSDSF